MNHREAVGGLWEEIGELQFDFMVKQGLGPHHKLLDIGCGCLRGGVKFIEYLNSGNYFGADKDAAMLYAGHLEAAIAGLSNKWYTLKQNAEFGFASFDTEFDFAIAQSLFTHLNLNEILLCLINVEKVLRDNGVLYATFFNCPGILVYDTIISHYTHDEKIVHTKAAFSRSMHYTFEMLNQAARWSNLKAEYVGKWNHPRKQEMVVFYK